MKKALIGLLCNYSRTQKVPEVGKYVVKAYGMDWKIPPLSGIVSFEPLNDTSIEITDATWGRFLSHMPGHRYTDFYRATMDGIQYYFECSCAYVDEFHGMFRPISKNTCGDVIDEKTSELLVDDALKEYLDRKLYFT